ncbi:MAG TPA: LacI family DNA-binding transcriptional regulator [Agriterribacter sp.]|nr:LacI family DNA-binding transcriptional regulator [Agriterribacter sp.]
MTQLSIKDIARLAGVVPSTVSFVINGKEKEMRISEQMAKKIRKIIKDTGYIPNRSAASLRTGKTHVIGLIVEDISNIFFSLLAKAIEDVAYKVGYRVVYCSTENNDSKGAELIRMLYKQVDGFIITPSSGMLNEVVKLKNTKKPVVLLDRYFPGTGLPAVLVNNKGCIEKGVNLLVNKGYRNIAFVVTALEQMQMRERLDAFTDSIKKHNVHKTSFVLKLPFSVKEGAYENRIKKFLNNNPGIDALFFATNYLSLQGLKVLQELQWNIPGRVGVLSFDDHDIFKLYTPSVTAINQPVAEIARRGIEILNRQIKDGENGNENQPLLLNAKLIIRNSL